MFALRLLLAGVLAGLALPVNAMASDLQLFLVDRSGDPVPGAVVTLHPLEGQTPPVTAIDDLEVVQRQLQFDPGQILAPLGSAVSFPNEDATAHHVYSFSPAKVFDLRLIAGGASEAVVFDQAGVVAIGCNIHDAMVGFIHVVDTPWAAMSQSTGLVQIEAVPNGRYRMDIWHQGLNARDKIFRTEITLDEARTQRDYELDIRRVRDRGGRYRR